MTKILVNNFPNDAATVTVKPDTGEKERINFSVGYDPDYRSEEIIAGGLTSFFSSLIIHDEVFLTYSDYFVLLKEVGVTDMLKLLDRKIIKILLDRTAHVIEHGKTLSFGSLSPVQDAMEDLEEKTKSLSLHSAREKSLLLQFSDNASIPVPEHTSDIVTDELKNDLARGTFSKFGISTTSIEDIQPADVIKILRIAAITRALILQNQLGVDSLVQDGFVKQYLSTKLGAFSDLVGNDSIALFSTINALKGIPDIYTLYKHGTVTMEDIIACRDAFSGGLFRKWYASTDYDVQKVLQALTNRNTKESQLMKLARLIYPNVLGLIGPITGMAFSAIDSYIVNKLVGGWNPSLFLDDIYKQKIDQRVAMHELAEQRRQIVKRFGNVGRNEPCPCQSGKKFKNCHGK